MHVDGRASRPLRQAAVLHERANERGVVGVEYCVQHAACVVVKDGVERVHCEEAENRGDHWRPQEAQETGLQLGAVRGLGGGGEPQVDRGADALRAEANNGQTADAEAARKRSSGSLSGSRFGRRVQDCSQAVRIRQEQPQDGFFAPVRLLFPLLQPRPHPVRPTPRAQAVHMAEHTVPLRRAQEGKED